MSLICLLKWLNGFKKNKIITEDQKLLCNSDYACLIFANNDQVKFTHKRTKVDWKPTIEIGIQCMYMYNKL